MLCVSEETSSCKIREIKMKHPSTPVNVPALSKALSYRPNRCFVNYIITDLVQLAPKSDLRL